MPTYTVKKGDTLSKIGKLFGVDYRKITGYRSGNPNLIYAGENLTIPDATTTTPTVTPTITPTTTTTPPETPQVTGTSDAARQSELTKIKNDLNAGLTAPKSYKSLDEFNKMREEKGVVNDEAELATIHNEARQLKETVRQFGSTAGEQTSEAGRLGMVSEAERNANFRLEGLSIREQGVVDRLNTKNAYINTAINLGTQDYTTALNQYNNEYSKNYQAIQLYNQQADQQKKDALTGFTTIANLMKDKNLGMADISPTLKAQIDSLTLKAGLPEGIFEAFTKAKPGFDISAIKEVTNDYGGKDFYFVTNDKNGKPSLVKIGSAGAGSQDSKFITSPGGVTYDMSSYATDPNHAIGIQNILNSMGQLKTTQDITAFIKQSAPNSPITANMIQSASQQYGVGWEEILAVMKQESNLGTLGMAVSTKNPGNVGNMDNGKKTAFSTWQQGVDAVAEQLASRTTTVDLGEKGGVKVQQKLEQDYRQVLVKEVSNRSGTIGTEDAKVALANHLASIYDQYYDPKTGNYNIPTAQYGEVILGLASLLSKTGTPTDNQINEVNQLTAKGQFNKAVSFVTGTAQTGNTQAIIKNLKDSIDRQARVAVQNREAGLKVLRGLAPTDLNPKRRAALEQNTLVPYSGIGHSNSPQKGQTQTYQGATYTFDGTQWVKNK